MESIYFSVLLANPAWSMLVIEKVVVVEGRLNCYVTMQQCSKLCIYVGDV